MLARPWVHIYEPGLDSAPWLTQQAVSAAAQLFARPIAYHPLTGLYNIDQQVHSRVPSVAIVGESNVGKSTLLNQLLYDIQPTSKFKLSSQQIPYSPVSDTPGRTRHVFRFDLSDRLRICDLPGYGHAMAPREVMKSWNSLIDRFLDVADLRRVIVLIDAKRGIKELDQVVLNMLQDRGQVAQIVLTKIDRVSQDHLHHVLAHTIDQLQRLDRRSVFPYVHAVSALHKMGMLELKCCLASIAT